MGIDYLIFGNVDSRDYGIEVFFKDVDRTPKRVYQRIEVPGRNGAILIDENRYEDVPVSYDCIALLDADRKAFVNALAAQAGYKRLQDSFNDDEFYSASFDGDVDPYVTKDRAQSTFTVDFTRSAQRYLISGETELTLESGDTLTNPTLFDSSPLLAVEGYGTIGFNGYEIEIENATMGEVVVVENPSVSTPATELSGNWNIDRSLFNDGDILTWKPTQLRFKYDGSNAYNIASYVCTSVTERSGSASGWSYNVTQLTSTSFAIDFYFPQVVSSTETSSYTSFGIDVNTRSTFLDSSSSTASENNSVMFGFTALSNKRKTAYIRCSNLPYIQTATLTLANIGNVVADSTISIAGNPTYVDCDLGEAYKYEDGQAVSLNAYIDLGSDLPKLASGANEITYDNTITELKITPRWWRV